jgi:hypothetical protein
MEYVTYILIILGIMGLCILVFRRRGDEYELGAGRNRTITSQSRAMTEAAGEAPQPDSRLNVPAPWGWPGNQAHVGKASDRTVSETLHRLVEQLVSEKQTIENSEYLLKRKDNLRILIEDRYGVVKEREAEADDKTTAASHFRGTPRLAERGSLQEVKTPWGW